MHSSLPCSLYGGQRQEYDYLLLSCRRIHSLSIRSVPCRWMECKYLQRFPLEVSLGHPLSRLPHLNLRYHRSRLAARWRCFCHSAILLAAWALPGRLTRWKTSWFVIMYQGMSAAGSAHKCCLLGGVEARGLSKKYSDDRKLHFVWCMFDSFTWSRSQMTWQVCWWRGLLNGLVMHSSQSPPTPRSLLRNNSIFKDVKNLTITVFCFLIVHGGSGVCWARFVVAPNSNLIANHVWTIHAFFLFVCPGWRTMCALVSGTLAKSCQWDGLFYARVCFCSHFRAS